MPSCRIVLGMSFLGVACAGLLWGQAGAPPASTPNPSAPTPSGPGANRSPSQPTQPNFPGRDQQQQNRTQFPEMRRPIFLSGKVMMEDGTPPPEQVTIERVCNGIPKPEGYTSNKGTFSFELGRNAAMMADSSMSSMNDDVFNGSIGGQRNNNPNWAGRSNGVTEQSLMGCELRANLPGFRSDSVNLAGRRMLDNPDVGTIVLRRMAKVEGFTFSATSGMAPKDAKKSFEKGRELAKKKKFEQATMELEKATQIYPKYALAWYDLGLLYDVQKRPDDAAKAYESAVAADSKFVNPYPKLALFYGQKKDWAKTAEVSSTGIRLNPYEFPELYFYHAVASLNLNKIEDAEKSVREAKKSVGKNPAPRLDHLLGVILLAKNDVNGAAESFRAYLKTDPQGPEVEQVKKQLEKMEQALVPAAK